jgi:predicted  nucleic acid-binding Zn-ribbon protein
MSELTLLFRLQELDLQIEAQNQSLQEIGSALGETEELLTARAQVDSLRELLHDQEQRLRELEWDADRLTSHISDDEKKLYGGRVRNPKELTDIQKDVEQYRTQRSAIEDRELQLMADVEATQAELERAQTDLQRIRVAWEARQRELSTQQTVASERLETIQASRAEVGALVSAESISLYEKLRREKRGRAVSKVDRSTCQGCRITLPVGVVSRVRAGREYVYCPSCGRLLYA